MEIAVADEAARFPAGTATVDCPKYPMVANLVAAGEATRPMVVTVDEVAGHAAADCGCVRPMVGVLSAADVEGSPAVATVGEL